MIRNRFVRFAWISSIFLFFGFSYQGNALKQESFTPQNIFEPSCRRVYERLYRKRIIDMRIVFGYKDSRPARFVGDFYEKNALIETLILPCSSDSFACGFYRSPFDSDLLLKTVVGLDQKERRVFLHLLSSAVGPDDDDNRSNRFQKWKSKKAEDVFFEGIAKADIVFYNGHARDGGGPDFEPPRLLKNRRVNYGWYLTKNRGPKKIQKALVDPLSSIQLIGLYSCVSEKLIPKSPESEKVAWIASAKLVYYADAMQGLIEALSSILGMKCKDDFKFGDKETGSSLSHFF